MATALRPIVRGHAAAGCFEQLARAILRGEHPPGSRLPPERELAEGFGVSRVIVRQAVHRLADLGLVHVRQGGATLVADPAGATDLRVLELELRLGPASAREQRDLLEAQLLRGHALLVVAELHGAPAALAALGPIVEEYGARGATAAGLAAFEKRFWCAVAEAGGNVIHAREAAWWYRLLEQHPASIHPPAARLGVYRELARRLAAGRPVAQFYLEITRAALAGLPRRR